MFCSGYVDGIDADHPGIAAPRALRERAVKLLVNSRMPNTRGKQSTAWRSWRRFCSSVKADPVSPSERLLILFTAWLHADDMKVATARQYISQVDAFLATFGVDLCSADMPRLRLALDGFKRLEPAKARKAKFRITFRVLKQLARLVGSSRKERTLWALCVAATQGLFRLGELTNAMRPLTWGSSLRDLGPHAVAVYLPDSKADLLRLGIEVILTTIPDPCAVPLLRALRVGTSPADPIFAINGAPATKVMVTDFLSSLLTKAGLSTKGFSGQSFRQGGAQSLFDAGVPIEDIKLFGRWKSDAFRAYIEMTLERVQGFHSRMAAAPAQTATLIL